MTLSGSVDASAKYSADRKRRSQLLHMATQVEATLIGLGMVDELVAVQQLKKTIESETFKVLILGEFNTGKSTLHKRTSRRRDFTLLCNSCNCYHQ